MPVRHGQWLQDAEPERQPEKTPVPCATLAQSGRTAARRRPQGLPGTGSGRTLDARDAQATRPKLHPRPPWTPRAATLLPTCTARPPPWHSPWSTCTGRAPAAGPNGNSSSTSPVPEEGSEAMPGPDDSDLPQLITRSQPPCLLSSVFFFLLEGVNETMCPGAS